MSRKYKDQFEVQTVETKNGCRKKVNYKGNYYSATVPAEKLNRYKVALKGTSLAKALFFIGMGLINNDGSRVFYVILPYAILLLPIFFMLISSIAFGRTKDKLTVPEYDKTVVRIKTAAIAALIVSIAGAVGGVFFILSEKGNTLGQEIIFIAGYFVIAVCAFMSIQIHTKIRYEKDDKMGHEAAET